MLQLLLTVLTLLLVLVGVGVVHIIWLLQVAFGEWQEWVQGKVRAFDDSFVHQVWHNGTRERIVLIAFMWHPDFLSEDFANKKVHAQDMAAAALTQTAVQAEADHRQRLVNFWNEHAADKLEKVDKTLLHYKGREETLFANLELKYKMAIPPYGTSSSSGTTKNDEL
jgi:hypothetical protein